jgi:hypothetical protein
MAARRALDKRGDPEEPFKRRPDFDYLGNFTSCLSVLSAGDDLGLPAGTNGEPIFSLSPAVQVTDLHRVIEMERIGQSSRGFNRLPQTRSVDKSTVQGAIPIRLH